MEFLIFLALPSPIYILYGSIAAISLFKYGKNIFYIVCVIETIFAIPLINYVLFDGASFRLGESTFVSIAVSLCIFIPIYISKYVENAKWWSGVLQGTCLSIFLVPAFTFIAR
jgi:hypothetical protein